MSAYVGPRPPTSPLSSAIASSSAVKARRFFEATQGAPSLEALQSALNVIEAKAHFDAPERVVHVRVGGLDERLLPGGKLDLSTEPASVRSSAAGGRAPP